MNDTNGKLASRLYPSHIDIPVNVRTEVVTLLNQSLAATADLKSQVKQAHWNVKGTDKRLWFLEAHIQVSEVKADGMVKEKASVN